MIDMFNQGLTISEIARRTENSRVFATTAAVELMAVVASGLGGARWPRLLSLLAEAFGISPPPGPAAAYLHGGSRLQLAGVSCAIVAGVAAAHPRPKGPGIPPARSGGGHLRGGLRGGPCQQVRFLEAGIG